MRAFSCYGVAVAASLLVPWPNRAAAAENDSHPPPAVGAIMPRLSPSGEQIAFSYQGAIWRMPAAGGTMTRLTAGDGFDVEPAWSPDGTLVAYLKSRDFGGGPLQLVRADDGAPVALPQTVAARDRLFFSRDGRRILGNFVDERQNPRLAWFDVATGRVGEALYPLQRRQKFALSNDGRWIAAVAARDLVDEQTGNNGPQNELWKIPADGGEPQKLVEWPARIYDLCWSADDRSLVVVTDAGGAHDDLWQLPLDDPRRGATKLTFGAADEAAPSVSADGRRLLYTDNRHGPTQLVLRDTAGGRETVVPIAALDFRAPTGRLELLLTDDDANRPVTARVSLQHADGKYHAPPGALYRLYGDLHFYAEGRAALALPAGRYQIKVARGPEYRISRLSCEVRADATTTQTVRLRRWTDQAARGWHSGESHIHANYGYGHWYDSPRTMLAQCAGENLRACNFMVANSDGDGVFDREYFLGRPDPLSTAETVLYWNQEFRSTIWGHMTLLDLKQVVEPVFTGFLHTTNPHDHPTNADVAAMTHDQHGHVNYTHPAMNADDPYLGAYSAKELPIDVALGTVDSIDVMGSNHRANLPLWYRLLNCGFHVPASAGTDCFLNRVNSRLPGSDRVYVRIDGEFSYDRWIAGLKAGRTFVTNGPMIDFTVDGRPAGDVLRFDGPTEAKVAALVRAEQALQKVEIVHDGAVVATVDVGDAGGEMRVERSVPVRRSGWLAVRAIGAPHPLQTRNEAFAHSGPVYLEVAGAPPESRADARYFLTWIDRLWETVRRRNRIPPRQQEHVESQVARARAVYQKLAGEVKSP